MSAPSPPTPRLLIPAMRIPLVAAAVVLLALGLDLTLLPTRTDRFFSWTIKPPLTAAVLGAFYLPAFALLVDSLRGWMWARARVLLPGGILFSALAVVATLMHFDRFHQNSPDPLARAITWIWLGAYALLPPALLAAWIPQVRAPGEDPPADPPPRWLRGAVGLQGRLMLVAGAALFVVPKDVARIWPWALTPLTGRVLGAWTLGLGLVFAYAAWEKDWLRLRASTLALALFGLLQILALARFDESVVWGDAGVWVYAAFPASALFVGALGLVGERRLREIS